MMYVCDCKVCALVNFMVCKMTRTVSLCILMTFLTIHDQASGLQNKKGDYRLRGKTHTHTQNLEPHILTSLCLYFTLFVLIFTVENHIKHSVATLVNFSLDWLTSSPGQRTFRFFSRESHEFYIGSPKQGDFKGHARISHVRTLIIICFIQTQFQ